MKTVLNKHFTHIIFLTRPSFLSYILDTERYKHLAIMQKLSSLLYTTVYPVERYGITACFILCTALDYRINL